ncbi:MAG: LPS assembly protein LptD [Arsenophonus sp.]
MIILYSKTLSSNVKFKIFADINNIDMETIHRMIKKNYYTLFTTMILIAFHSQKSHGNITKECMLGVPKYTKSIKKDNPNNITINITAKEAAGEYPLFIEYKGNVNIQQGNQTITANEVKLTQKETTNQKPLRRLVITGNVHYDDPKIIIKGTKAWLNLNNKDMDVEKADYLMLGRYGRGFADKMKIRNEKRYTILEKGMFTSCPQNRHNWSIDGKKVIFDHKEEIIKIWNARFRINKIPIFYSPYLQLHIGNKRQSGFSLPNTSYSKSSGLELEVPFYWNIAHNYNATITPQLMTFRGLKLRNEFRYLSITGVGAISFDWLKHDRNYIKDKNSGKYPLSNTNDRWLLYWRNFGVLDKICRLNIDYTKVSDSKYFTDFTSKYGNSTDGYVTQKFSIACVKPNWQATLTYKQFQIFINSHNSKAYKTEPQLDFYFYKNNLWPFDIKTYVQISRISSVTSNNPDAIRLHIEPELNLYLSNNSTTIKNTINIMATYYNQNIPHNLTDSKLKKEVTRILPSITSDAKFIFEHNLLINNNYIQTMEARVQYFYVPYRDQTNINNYDSSLLQNDYNSLFRNRIYGGLDRISSANQLTSSITARLYNKKLSERFNFSIGHRYYFEHPRNIDSSLPIRNKNNVGSFLLSGESYLRITDKFGLRGGLQYDGRFSNITIGNIITECQFDSDSLIQLNYRFVNSNYIKTTIKNVTSFQKGISQIGAVGSWHFGRNLGLVGSYYYDINENRSSSRSISFQYTTCCWSVNMSYEGKTVTWQHKNFSSDYDGRLSFNVELRGLNNNHNSKSYDMLVGSSILPYKEAF